MAPKFAGAPQKAEGLTAALSEVSDQLGCTFYDTGAVTAASAVDGIHLDASQHVLLGRALSGVVRAVLALEDS